MSNTLPQTDDKRALLAEQTRIVHEGLATFRAVTVQIAQALAVIHKKELYRLTHKTFEEFCANNLI